MALAQVIPELWAKEVETNLQNMIPLAAVTNQSFSSNVFGKGDTLHILFANALTDNAYTASNITYEALGDTKADLAIDLARYVAFANEDSDKALTDVNYLSKVLLDASYQLSDYFDATGMAQYANATLKSYATGTTDWQFTKDTCANIPQFFAFVRKQMKDAKAPAGQMYVIANPEFEAACNIYFGNKGANSGLSDAVVSNGFSGKFFGVNVYTSNNCVTETTSTHGIAGIEGKGLALAKRIVTDEGLRLEGRIADGYRMLALGGFKMYQPAYMVDVNLNEAVIATA